MAFLLPGDSVHFPFRDNLGYELGVVKWYEGVILWIAMTVDKNIIKP